MFSTCRLGRCPLLCVKVTKIPNTPRYQHMLCYYCWRICRDLECKFAAKPIKVHTASHMALSFCFSRSPYHKVLVNSYNHRLSYCLQVTHKHKALSLYSQVKVCCSIRISSIFCGVAKMFKSFSGENIWVQTFSVIWVKLCLFF